MAVVFFTWKILKGAPKVVGRPGAKLAPIDFKKLKADLVELYGSAISDSDVLSSALYPKVFEEYQEFRKTYGPVDKLDTRTFFIGTDIANENIVSSDDSDESA